MFDKHPAGIAVTVSQELMNFASGQDLLARNQGPFTPKLDLELD
jgi:hypothetical protein